MILRKYIQYFSFHNNKCRFSLFLALFMAFSTYAQKQQTAAFLNYIDQFKAIAIAQQQEYGIPASITLAQGLLESQAGSSPLATEGNNHFGIKCHKEWTGDVIYHDDDAMQECFRKYDNPAQSYEDHAKFLKRKRYAPLYSLNVTDYKSWAQTLKSCGYATDPSYPDKLIDIIERYELYRFDSNQPIVAEKQSVTGDESLEHEEESPILDETSMIHIVRQKWGLRYIVTHDGDTFDKICDEFGLKKEKLFEFNDLGDKPSIKSGSVLYLQEKEKCAAIGNDSYTVKMGDTLRSISQEYGIRLKNLCKLNSIAENHKIKVGQTLLLR
jgi:LysM repeat protein